jgi:hypothetical protein
MPLRYAHLDPGHLAHYADRTVLSPDPRGKSGTLEDELLDTGSQVTEFIGKGGTRTLDPAIMSAVVSSR